MKNLFRRFASLFSIEKRIERIEEMTLPPKPDMVVAYMVSYDYQARRHANSKFRIAGKGHTVVHIEGGATSWEGVKQVTDFIAQTNSKATGLVCSDVRINSFQEINRWKKELSAEELANLSRALGQ